jgi:aminopeptidase N
LFLLTDIGMVTPFFMLAGVSPGGPAPNEVCPMAETLEAAQKPQSIRLEDYKPSSWLIETVDLDVSLAPKGTRVKSRLTLKPNPASAAPGGPLRLDGETISLVEVKVAGKKLSPDTYTVDDKGLTLHAPPAKAFTLELTTTCDPEANKALSGLYRSSGNYCTQCEAEGFRRITYFLDRPDVLATYRVRVEADKAEAPVLLGNGNLVESGDLPKGRHFAVWEDPFKKPSYLFALVGGKLAHVEDHFTTMSGRKVTLRIYVEPGKEDRCGWAMDSLKRSMKWDEKAFGREYDLDIFMIVAVSDFNMGAMENKGLNIFNDKLVLASADTATDGNYEAIEAVIAHEYFHNWTGNRITCRDWFQLCLKEGLTVFRDQEFSSDERSRTVQRIADVRGLRSSQFPEDAGPLAHPVRPETYMEINNFYTATVYEKGAEVCRMIHTLLGAQGFRKGMDLYFERHDGEATTVEKFITCFEDATGADLQQMMLWYRQSGTPELVCSTAYDKKTQTLDLTVEQVLSPTPGQLKKRPFHIPLRMGLIGGNGQDLPLVLDGSTPVKDGLIELKKAKETFRFSNVPSRPVLSLLRGFSAPVNLTLETSPAELEFQMVHDSDLYNRWQAGQTYAMRNLTELVAAVRAGKKPKAKPSFAKALRATLTDESLEPAYRAQFLVVPGESDIARELKKDVDPDAIHSARLALVVSMAEVLHDELTALYDAMAIKGVYKPDAKSVGKRSLRHAALGILSRSGKPADVDRLAEHFARAKNMTEQLTALSILANHDVAARGQALAAFEKQWSGDPLVMDKWFASVAMSSLPGALDEVRALTKHKLFSMQNPNKVRSLIGMFAHGNPTQFNRDDGEGYRFVADAVMTLNGFNPQVAARMLGAFESWRTLEAGRKKRAKAALKGIADAPNLSRDVLDIVTRTLG